MVSESCSPKGGLSVPRPAPKRRADVPTIRSDTESARGRRSANGPSIAPRHAKPGTRRRTRRSSMIPTPAVLGATALVIAGGGAVIVSSNSGSGVDTYDPATSQLTAEPGATYARGGGVLDVSRSVDRETLQKQARQQARQLMRSREQLAQQAEKHAADVAANQWVL